MQERFGTDACIEEMKKNLGIAIEPSQKEILIKFHMSESPNLVTAYAEECRELFPTDEDFYKFHHLMTLLSLVLLKYMVLRHVLPNMASVNGKWERCLW